MLFPLLTPSLLDAVLETVGLDTLPPIEGVVNLNLQAPNGGCLFSDDHSSEPSSWTRCLPKVTLTGRLETRRGLKSDIGDLETISKLLSQAHPTAEKPAQALKRVCDSMCDGIDSLYTPAVIAAHLARSALTLELPERLCSLVISFGSGMPTCGHEECVLSYKQSGITLFMKMMGNDDKITFTINSDLLNCFTSPAKLLRTVMPLLATLIRPEYFTPLRRLPITLSTHFYRRNLIDTSSPSIKPRKSIKKGALRRSLKRKASSRLLICEIGTAALAQSTTRSGGRKSSPAPTSALAALQLISKEKKLRMK